MIGQPTAADWSSSPAYAWNEIIASLPEPHVLQSWEWGQTKIRNGWQPFHLVWIKDSDQYSIFSHQQSLDGFLQSSIHNQQLPAPQFKIQNLTSKIEAAALALKRAIPIRGFAARLSVIYIPKGPLLRDWGDAALRARVLDDLRTFARRQGAIFIKIDPDVRLGVGIPGTPEACEEPLGAAVADALTARGWHFSAEQVQFRNTVMLDLSLPEDELLGRMKQKTRYNVRLAQRKGLTVRAGSEADVELLYNLYAETAQRDGFVIRDFEYYRDLWGRFMRPIETLDSDTVPAGSNFQTATLNLQPVAQALIAEIDGDAAAAVLVFRFAGKAWYLYGMSRTQYREKMPNPLLQWEAMRQAKAAGCTTYDLWGAPDEFSESDPLWGVWRFKEGLGGQVVRHIGAWDLPVQPVFYRLYTQLLPRLLNLMRRRAHPRQIT